MATAHFFEKYFGCEIVTAGDHVLLKRDGFDIVLDRIAADAGWPANFHFGFEMATAREVRELHQVFREEGVHMESAVFNNARGSRFFCRTPEGVMIEINTREDKEDGWQRLF